MRFLLLNVVSFGKSSVDALVILLQQNFRVIISHEYYNYNIQIQLIFH